MPGIRASMGNASAEAHAGRVPRGEDAILAGGIGHHYVVFLVMANVLVCMVEKVDACRNELVAWLAVGVDYDDI